MSNKIIYGMVLAAFSFSSAASAVSVLDGLREARGKVELLDKKARKNVWAHGSAAAVQVGTTIVFPPAAISFIFANEVPVSHIWRKVLGLNQESIDQIDPAIRFLTQIERIYRDLHPNGVDDADSEKVDVTSRLSKSPKDFVDILSELSDRETRHDLIDRIHLANMIGMGRLVEAHPVELKYLSSYNRFYKKKEFSYYISPSYFVLIKHYIVHQEKIPVIAREVEAPSAQVPRSTLLDGASDRGAANGNSSGMDSKAVAPPAYDDEKRE